MSSDEVDDSPPPVLLLPEPAGLPPEHLADLPEEAGLVPVAVPALPEPAATPRIFSLAICPDSGVITLDQVEGVPELLHRLNQLYATIDKETKVFVFDGPRLRVTKPPRHVLVDDQLLPVVPPEPVDAEFDDSGSLL